MSTTESTSLYNDLEKMSTEQLLTHMNEEDHKVSQAIQKILPQVEALVEAILPKMQLGGRLFYIGAGTSGRLGVVDASECPPTFGVDHNTVVGIIAGGDTAIREAVENAEDDSKQAWIDLQEHQITALDSVVGIAASGRTPYVIGGVSSAKENGSVTGCIVCNDNSAVAKAVSFPVEVVSGPEFLTGSTRMKAGTAQKMVLNMLSTALMIRLGKVKGNKMVDMQLSNEKLMQRGTGYIVEALDIPEDEAKQLLLAHGSVRKAIESYA